MNSLYLELLRDVLLNRHYARKSAPPIGSAEMALVEELKQRLSEKLGPWLAGRADSGEAAQIRAVLAHSSEEFCKWLRDNASEALVLQPESGLDNVRVCVESVLREKVPGDLVECGVWRGGVTLYMRAILKAHDIRDRSVWALDSFEGLPEPDLEQNPLDYLSYETLRLIGGFAVGVEEVKDTFRRFGLLDEQVRFVPGWFDQTVPQLEIGPIAVLRLDADFYASTVPLLQHLVPKVSPGGFVIIDDYGIPHMDARRAVDEYRQQWGVSAPLVTVNDQTVYWRV